MWTFFFAKFINYVALVFYSVNPLMFYSLFDSFISQSVGGTPFYVPKRSYAFFCSSLSVHYLHWFIFTLKFYMIKCIMHRILMKNTIFTLTRTKRMKKVQELEIIIEVPGIRERYSIMPRYLVELQCLGIHDGYFFKFISITKINKKLQIIIFSVSV